MKEIRIRKVLGANALDLIRTVSMSYLKIILLAFCISIPAAWIIINNWLDEFSYKIQPGPAIFLPSASLILFTTLIALIYHIIIVLKANPIDNLKYE